MRKQIRSSMYSHHLNRILLTIQQYNINNLNIAIGKVINKVTNDHLKNYFRKSLNF